MRDVAIIRHADGSAHLSRERAEWETQAACRHFDPEIFFPDKGGSSREAKLICAVCPVVEECRADADRAEQHQPRPLIFGVYGGESPNERWVRRRLHGKIPEPTGRIHDYRRVSEAYEIGGITGVMERLGISHAAASNVVVRARQRGLIPPTRRGATA